MIREKDIASRIGLSKQTVSAVLSGRWRERRICPQTKDRVLATARQMDYVPHHAARRLARSRPNNKSISFDQVGLIHLTWPDAQHAYVDPVCLAMMQGAEHELSKLHASLTFVRVTENRDWEKVERLARAGGVDGWLVYGPANDDVVSHLNRTKLPHVILGDHTCKQPVHAVNVDNWAVGRLAVEHLAALGHRRIAYLAGRMCFLHQEQILAGFRAALKGWGLEDDHRFFTNISAWEDPGVKHPIDWLQKLDPKPTAVFMPDFGVALALYPVLQQSQVEALRELSVLACGYASPQELGQDFTSIELPMSEVGRQGALLLHRLASQRRVESSEMKIAPSLIEGGSTRAPSSRKPKPTN